MEITVKILCKFFSIFILKKKKKNMVILSRHFQFWLCLNIGVFSKYCGYLRRRKNFETREHNLTIDQIINYG